MKNPIDVELRSYATIRQLEYLDAIEDPISFWNTHADDVHWFKKYENTLDDSNINFPKWFTGG